MTWCSPRARERRAACGWPCRRSKRKIDYINPHATSTPIGDKKEIEAIREVFGKDIPAISATKSLTGHSLGATGVQEAIYSHPDDEDPVSSARAPISRRSIRNSPILPIMRQRQDNAKIDTVMSNSFGFGGTNATLIFQRYNG